MNSELLPDRTILYKYTSTKGALATLITQSIRLAPLNKLNDPFEIYNMKLMEFDESELKERILEKLIAFLYGDIVFPYPSLFSRNGLEEFKKEFDKNPITPKDQMRASLTSFVENFVEKYKSNSEIISKKLWDEVFGDYVVFCTSIDPTNIKMLSHYADNHQGVVIGFQGLNKFDSARLASRQIIYQDNPPTLHTMDEYIKETFGEEIIDYTKAGRKMVFTKHSSWAEEKEMRLAYPAKNLHSDGYEYIKIDPEEIHSVYFGCRASSEEKRLMQQLLRLQYPHVIQYDLIENRLENKIIIAPCVKKY